MAKIPQSLQPKPRQQTIAELKQIPQTQVQQVQVLTSEQKQAISQIENQLAIEKGDLIRITRNWEKQRATASSQHVDSFLRSQTILNQRIGDLQKQRDLIMQGVGYQDVQRFTEQTKIQRQQEAIFQKSQQQQAKKFKEKYGVTYGTPKAKSLIKGIQARQKYAPKTEQIGKVGGVTYYQNPITKEVFAEGTSTLTSSIYQQKHYSPSGEQLYFEEDMPEDKRLPTKAETEKRSLERREYQFSPFLFKTKKFFEKGLSQRYYELWGFEFYEKGEREKLMKQKQKEIEPTYTQKYQDVFDKKYQDKIQKGEISFDKAVEEFMSSPEAEKIEKEYQKEIVGSAPTDFWGNLLVDITGLLWKSKFFGEYLKTGGTQKKKLSDREKLKLYQKTLKVTKEEAETQANKVLSKIENSYKTSGKAGVEKEVDKILNKLKTKEAKQGFQSLLQKLHDKGLIRDFAYNTETGELNFLGDLGTTKTSSSVFSLIKPIQMEKAPEVVGGIGLGESIFSGLKLTGRISSFDKTGKIGSLGVLGRFGNLEQAKTQQLDKQQLKVRQQQDTALSLLIGQQFKQTDKEKQILRQPQLSASALLTGQTLRQPQALKQPQLPKYPTPTQLQPPRQPQQPRQPLKPPTPTITPFGFMFPRERKMIDKSAYDVHYLRDATKKVKRSWVKIGDNLSRMSALSKGSYIVDKNVSRQFKLTKQKGVKPKKTKDRSWETRQHKFRTFRQIKGRAFPMHNQFIEKTRYAIDSPQEKKTLKRERMSSLLFGNFSQPRKLKSKKRRFRI